jgi:hypothetical protein
MKRLFSIALLLTIGFTTAQAQKLKTAEEYNNRGLGPRAPSPALSAQREQ